MCDLLVIASLVLFDTLQINTCTASGISEITTRKFSFVSVLTHKIILLLPHSVNAIKVAKLVSAIAKLASPPDASYSDRVVDCVTRLLHHRQDLEDTKSHSIMIGAVCGDRLSINNLFGQTMAASISHSI